MDILTLMFFVFIYVVLNALTSKKPENKNEEIDFVNYNDIGNVDMFAKIDNLKSKNRRQDPSLPKRSLTPSSALDLELPQNIVEEMDMISEKKTHHQPARRSNPTQNSNRQEAVSFERDALLKAFVMKELMQRYDLNRIYERIPSFSDKDE